MYHSFLIHSSADGHLGCFHVLAIINSAAMLSIVKQIASPGLMHETSAQGWCTRMTQRDGMEREVGWGLRMGNTCKCKVDSYQCMAKSTTIL